MKLDPTTYADFMTRLDEVEDLLYDVEPSTAIAEAHFSALAHDLDELLDGYGIYIVENEDFVEHFVEVWKRFQ